MAHGFGKFRGIKIISWNKGSKYMINKMKEIKELLDQYNPHILALSEAQIRKEDINNIHFENYNIEVDNLIHTNSMARSCILIHKDIRHERLEDIEPHLKSVIVIKIGLKHNKKFTYDHSLHSLQQSLCSPLQVPCPRLFLIVLKIECIF